MAAGVFLVILVAAPLWLPLVGQFLVVADPLQPAEAVVPLAGGEERVLYATRLFQEGYAHTFIATNMPLKVPGIRTPYGELVKTEATWRGVPADNILVAPELVETTSQEALAVQRLVLAQGIHSLLIVTDPFHTRRARMIFSETFRDTGVTTLVVPVPDSWYRADVWWQTQDSLRETWTEYLKLILYIIGYR